MTKEITEKISELNAGLSALNAGAVQVADGVKQISDGASELSASLSELKKSNETRSEGADQIFAAMLNAANDRIAASALGDAGITLHLWQLAGSNSHHIIEGAFKAFARSLSDAVRIDPANADRVPSTKGVLG